MPYPGLLHPEPLPLRQATADPYLLSRHSNTGLSQSLWGLWVLVRTRFVWTLWASLAGMGFDSKHDFGSLQSCWSSFALGRGVSPHSPSSTTQTPLQCRPSCWGFFALVRETSSVMREECSADPAVRPAVGRSIGMRPGQEGGILRVRRQTQGFWSQQKQAHLDSQAHLSS